MDEKTMSFWVNDEFVTNDGASGFESEDFGPFATEGEANEKAAELKVNGVTAPDGAYRQISVYHGKTVDCCSNYLDGRALLRFII